MNNKFLRLTVAMPGKVVLDEDVDMVILSAADGDKGILPNHEPVSFALRDGPLSIRRGGAAECEAALAVAGGFATVRDGVLNVMTPIADTPERIGKAIESIVRERELNKAYEQTANMEANRAEAAIRHILVRREGSAYSILKGNLGGGDGGPDGGDS